ncbi:hypothetical protein VPH35_118811 [Triticum aestivum]
MHATSNCCVLHMHALVTMRSMDGLSGLIRGNLCYSAGLGGGLTVDIDANGRKVGKKGVYQFVDKYGANVDGYSPIYTPEEWSESGDRYAGGTTGLLIWAVTLAGLLGGGVLLVYNTSALAG